MVITYVNCLTTKVNFKPPQCGSCGVNMKTEIDWEARCKSAEKVLGKLDGMEDVDVSKMAKEHLQKFAPVDELRKMWIKKGFERVDCNFDFDDSGIQAILNYRAREALKSLQEFWKKPSTSYADINHRMCNILEKYPVKEE